MSAMCESSKALICTRNPPAHAASYLQWRYRNATSAKRLLLLNFTGEGGGCDRRHVSTEQRRVLGWHTRRLDGGITGGSSELRGISNPKHNTFYLLPHSGKQELAHGSNSRADLVCLALPTGRQDQKQGSFALQARKEKDSFHFY